MFPCINIAKNKWKYLHVELLLESFRLIFVQKDNTYPQKRDIFMPNVLLKSNLWM